MRLIELKLFAELMRTKIVWSEQNKNENDNITDPD